MKPALLLRIALVLTFIHAVLHTIGGVLSSPASGAQQATIALMKANPFPVMGFMRTYWDFQRGEGLAISILMLVEATVFWQLAPVAEQRGWPIRPVLATFTVGYLALAVNSYEYFFPAPVVTEVLIALFLGLTIRACGPVRQRPAQPRSAG